MNSVVDLEEFYFTEKVNINDENLISVIESYTTDEIMNFISTKRDSIQQITKANITQFSDIDAVIRVLQIVDAADDDVDFLYVGYMFNKGAKEGAQRKYGENHIKLAIQMGLLTTRPFKLTPLGKKYLTLNDEERKVINPKLYLRVPVVQKIILCAESGYTDGTKILLETLKESTAIRRRSNIKTMLTRIIDTLPSARQMKILENLRWS